MAEPFIPKFVDLVRNFTTTQGTGNFGLGAAVPGHSSLAGKVAPGDRFYYCAIGVEKPSEREIGRGTFLANGTVAREPVSGALTNFTSGTKTIALVVGAEWFSEIANARRGEEITPERFGAKGDGVTNDTAAFQALTAAINTAGGGVIAFRPGATYVVGAQTFGAARTTGRFTGYTGVPELLMEFANCTRPIVIRGNGATIKAAVGLKYGTFDATGAATSNVLPFYGAQLATGYAYMIRIIDCLGSVHIENLELDGGSPATVIGGKWGDAGWQIPSTGLALVHHSGGATITGVRSHHHPQDGIVINGVALSDAAPSEQIDVARSKFDYNGRLGLAFVGGRGVHFHNCTFNWNANIAATGSSVASNPASGADFEAEGGRYNRDVSFAKCDFIGNFSTQIVADSGTLTDRVSFDKCRFVQTVDNNYCLWPNRPGFTFNDCLIAGTIVSMWQNPLNPHEKVQFNRCIISNSNEYSPTGLTGTVNRLLFDSAGSGIVLSACLLDGNKAGMSANCNFDTMRLEDCTVRARLGTLAMPGRYSGRSEFVEDGGQILAIPGGVAVSFKNNGGHAEDRWAFTAGGVRTVHPATFDRQHNKPVYDASAAFDPPSLAAGAKSAIQTLTVTGAGLGDKVSEVSFSNDLAGARIHAWVSAANVVSFYAVNDNGANPLDLAAGTLRVRVVKA